jgi:mannitol-1-phosphate/altronate dehydrogenase
MEKFTPPKLPAMLDGSVMCVDANAWNALIEYVNEQTQFINSFVDVVNGLSEAESKDSEAIIEIAKDLKEHLEE